MCWELTFGVLLIIWGFSKIFGTLFNIHIPIFGIAFGIILLYLGFMMITGTWRSSHWCSKSGCKGADGTYSTCMGSSRIHVEEDALYNQKAQLSYQTVMGHSQVDLTHITPESLKAASTPLTVNVDTVFGKTELKLNKNVPVRIVGKSAFGKTKFPNDASIAFGTYTYQNPPEELPLMNVYVSTVFGETDITY